MDENTIIEQLEELIKRFGVHIRHEAIKQDEDSVNVVGGLCLLKGEYVLIINSKATIEDKIRALGMALKYFDQKVPLQTVTFSFKPKLIEQNII
jgi:hypothetical protein